jgi:predicted AAA+ superfamily ATPase
MYPRIYDHYYPEMQPGRVYILFGARQVGKTTLINTLLSHLPSGKRCRVESGDNMLIHAPLSSGRFKEVLGFAEGLDVLVIDEAQRIPNIGMALKILADQRPDLHIIVSGSSSFELAGQVGEPLTGRKKTLLLYPISLYELYREQSPYELDTQIEDFMLYGMYPAVLNCPTAREKQEVLRELAGAYLLKDILELERIKSSKALLDLLRLLAWQTGSEVSLSELGENLSLDKKTIQRYLGLLEQTFIIYEVRGFSRNLRKEIIRKSKYYFVDTGIRNVLINDFKPVSQRNDTGHLWENFLLSERMKTREYSLLAPGLSNESRFWRTWDQKEIDLIETQGNEIRAYEFKWNAKAAGKKDFPEEFRAAYPEAKCTFVTRENWGEFLLIEGENSDFRQKK